MGAEIEPEEGFRDAGEGALQHAQDRLFFRSSVFMASSDPIIIEDLQQRIIDLNPAAERAYGLERSELIGRPIDKLVPPGYRERAQRSRSACRDRKTGQTHNGIRVTKSGEQVPVSLSLYPILDSSGSVIAIGSTARDISDHWRQEELTRALRRAEERAEDRERKELANDLHDSVGQLLTLARIHTASAAQAASGTPVEGTIAEIQSVIEEVEKRTRTLMFRVNPSSLYQLGLAAAAEELAEDLGGKYGMKISVEDDQRPLPLDEGTRVGLFRGLRELLINVARHAQTDSARVRIEAEGGHVLVRVEDDGVGFDPKRPTAGFGLLGVRDRLERCGASLELESIPGDGTRAKMVARLSPVPDGETP